MNIRRYVGLTATVVGIIAALATVASFFGGIWWGLDLVAHFHWQLMWVAFAASIVYALTERGILTAVFLATAVVNLWLIAPAWIGSQPEATGEDAVSIVHIDLSGNVDDMSSVTSWLLTSGVDLVLVAGVTADQVAAVLLEGSPYVLLSGSDAQAGVVIIGMDHWTAETTLSEAGEPVHKVTVPSGAGVIDVVTAWGEMAKSQVSSDALTARFSTIAEVVLNTDNPTVVIGSLGATKWSHQARRLLSASTLRDATSGAGYLTTFQASHLPIVGRWSHVPIDTVYVDPDLTTLDLAVGPDIGAEHLPLSVVVGPVR